MTDAYIDCFLEAALVPRDASHGSGTLETADAIVAGHPSVARSSIYAAAVLADEDAVRAFLASDPKSATEPGGPRNWDALTHLCFSRYSIANRTRSEAFVRTARALLDAGANAQTGWTETNGHPHPRPVFESAIYGAAGLARNAELTRLLLERGADPNDEETPYHAPEGYDNAVVQVLVKSGKLNEKSFTTMLVRKADWHDEKGMKLLLDHGADPNAMTGHNALHQAIRRDNSLSIVELLLDHGANPALKNTRFGRTAGEMAARRGRGDILRLFERRGIAMRFEGVEKLIAACAMDEPVAEHPELLREGGALLSEFAGNGNVAGMRRLLDLGVGPDALYTDQDGYFGVAKNSTALHVAAWRAWPAAVTELLARGAAVNAFDGDGRTALQLAVKACVDSYWTSRRTPESVKALLAAGASTAGIKVPAGYEEVDKLLR